MLNLISTHDQKKLDLLTFFEKSNKQEIPQWKIEEVLNLSSFKATNLVSELADELQDYSSGLLEISDTKHITSYNIDTELVNQFKLFYLKNGPEFKLFYFFFKGKKNLPDLIDELNISQAAAYRLIANINSKLEPSGLAIKKQKIIGDEATLRLKTFELLTFYFKGMDDPFNEDLYKSHQQLIAKMALITPLSKSNSLQMKFYYILAISHYRIKNKAFIENNPLITYIPGKNRGITQLYNLLQTYYQETFSFLTADEVKNEVEYLFSFLISEMLLSLDDIEQSFKIDEKVISLTNDLENRLNQIGITLSEPQQQKQLTNQLVASLLKYFSFYYTTDSFSSDTVNTQFRELFTEASELVEEFLIEHSKELNYSEQANPLHYDLLFILITSISSKDFQAPLHVYVDFSRSVAYSNHIINNIQSFNSLNIIFDPIVSSETDLFISDFANYHIDIPQIIWRDPPTVNDWSILGDTLIDIKKEKYKK